MNRGHWGGLAGAPLGALAHLLTAWLSGFREAALTGAALHAVLRLAAVLAEVRTLFTCRVCVWFGLEPVPGLARCCRLCI